MFIITAKVPRRKIAFGVVLGAILCCCALTFQIGEAVLTASTTSAPSPKGIRTNQDRVDYLSAYGWQIKEEPLASQELIIPDKLDDSYRDYLALQQEQGFELERYAGKRVKRYTYEITNYPSGETGVQANLLLYRTTVVGGEVLSPQLNGFLHGLAMP